MLEIGLSEPAWRIQQIAAAVVLTALIVETMADLVADDGADAAIVGRIVRLGVEERRLQNRSREHDLIQLGIVIGIDSLSVHAPFGAIDWLAEFVEIALVLE